MIEVALFYPCNTGRLHCGGEMLVKRAGGAWCFIGYYGNIALGTSSGIFCLGWGGYARHRMMIRQIALLGYIKSMIHAGDSDSAQCMRLKNQRKEKKKRQEKKRILQKD